jgi:chromosome partitioning protein
MEKSVLLVDCDPQANATSGLNVQPTPEQGTVYKALFHPEQTKEMIYSTNLPYLFVLPSIQDLVAAELELVEKIGREYYLKDCLQQVAKDFDYIFLDCPPSLGLITVNALCAATHLLIPLQCEYYALEGIAHLMRTYKLIQNRLNGPLRLMGVVLTMFDRRNKLSHQVEQEVRSYFHEKVFASIIPRNVRLSEAPSHGLPALCYDYKSSGSQAYLQLGQEILNNQRAVAAA